MPDGELLEQADGACPGRRQAHAVAKPATPAPTTITSASRRALRALIGSPHRSPSRPQNVHDADSNRRLGSRSVLVDSTPEPRVRDGIENVREQIDNDIYACQHQNGRLDRGKVLHVDCVDEQLTHPWIREHRLGDRRAAQQ